MGGSNPYIEQSDIETATQPYTINFVGPDESVEVHVALLDILGGRLRMIADGRSINAGPLLATGTFQHVAGVYDGQVMTLFLDGVVTSSFDFGSVVAVPTNTLTLRIGADSLGANGFSGLIDEATIWDSALTASDINALATIPEPTTMLLFGTGVLGLIGYARRRKTLTQ